VVATLAALVWLAGAVDVTAAGVAESRAGQAPLLPGTASQAFVAQVLRPAAALDLHDSGLLLRLAYSPRILWQDPHPGDATGPLVLHTADLSLEARPLPALTLTAQASGAIGKPDYTALAQMLGATQGALPIVTTIASGTAVGSARVRLTPQADLDLRGQYFLWRALDVPDDAAAAGVVTSQAIAGVDPGVSVRLTPRDTVGLRVPASVAWYSTGTRYLTLAPVATWNLRLTPLETLRLTLGAAYTRPFGTTPGNAPPVTPVGSADLDATVARWESVVLRLTAGTAVNVFFDPVLGTATERAIARGGAALTVAPDWELSLRGDFGTALPYTTTVGDVTAFSVTSTVRRLLSPNAFVELGGLWADRGPALDAADFAFHQRQLWLFVSLSATTRATSRRPLPG
jgi:hypothetical protein